MRRAAPNATLAPDWATGIRRLTTEFGWRPTSLALGAAQVGLIGAGLLTEPNAAVGGSLIAAAFACALAQALVAAHAMRGAAAPSALVPVEKARSLESDLSDAIHGDKLHLVYQPIMNAAGERMIGVEALCRWRHAVLGDISPAAFIPIAERTGDICLLGANVLRRACRDAMAWPDLKVAVNVSSRQFHDPRFVDAVTSILAETGLAPARLELELTESVLVEDVEGVVAKLTRLKTLGISLALDDFGTSYSSLNYLLTLPFDKLKIDRSFVLKLDQGARGAAVVHAIVSLGRALGLRITAEGVELAAQHQFLRIAGVHSFQGYYFGKPVCAQEMTALLNAEALASRPAIVA